MAKSKGSIHGVLVLDKPAGITSRDAVDQACKQLRTREIGHCGTLDPLATGVLVLVVGRARRLQELLSRSRKVYRAVIRLGAFSETDDAEGPLHPFEPPPTPPSSEALERCVRTFVGEIEQRPPNYSAVKIGGQRLYDLARRGEAVEAPLRTVHVHEIDLEDYSFPEVTLRVSCAGGTYVRSIARDLGEILETGGYLAELSRIESGGFSLREGADLENLQRSDVLPLEQALQQMPRVDIAAMQAKRLANGAVIRADLPPLSLDPDEPLFGWVHGRAVALLKREGPGQVRAGRLLITVDDLKDLAEQELAAQDAADL